MSRQLIDRNEDLRQLLTDGFNIEIVAAHLVVRDVPYVTAAREVQRGILLCPLTTSGEKTDAPSGTHQMWFIGAYPCNADGSPIEAIRHSEGGSPVSDSLVPNYGFSMKPFVNGVAVNYDNYYDKVTTYVAHLEGPAQEIDPAATAKTHAVTHTVDDDDSPFRYLDTAAGRAGISMINQKLAASAVSIIGLGGTGSYLLDLVAKTPVKTIHLFDRDLLLTHNAFRSPGAARLDELDVRPYKVDYYKARYDPMRTGIETHPYNVDDTNADELAAMDFVFVCIDDADARGPIVEALERLGLPFIDVGMGVDQLDGSLGATLRVSMSSAADRDTLRRTTSLEEAEVDDEYSTDIQVADLNCFNAAMAVMRWKKWAGFYRDFGNEMCSTLTSDTNLLLNDRPNDED